MEKTQKSQPENDSVSIKVSRATHEKIKELAEMEKRDQLTIVELSVELYEKSDPHGRLQK